MIDLRSTKGSNVQSEHSGLKQVPNRYKATIKTRDIHIGIYLIHVKNLCFSVINIFQKHVSQFESNVSQKFDYSPTINESKVHRIFYGSVSRQIGK